MQIDVNGILFRSMPASSSHEMSISSSLYPAVLPIPSTAEISERIHQMFRNFGILICDVDVTERTLHYRIVSPDDQSSLAEIVSVMSQFNSDLTDFEPTTALVATWEIRIDSVMCDSSTERFLSPVVVS